MKDIEFAKQLQKIIEINAKEPERLNYRLQAELIDCSREEKFVEVAFNVQEWEKNPYGEVHGGAVCAFFDASMGLGAVGLSPNLLCTTDLSVSYLKPFNGDRYIFRAEYTHIGSRMIRVIGKAFDAHTGNLNATAIGSFMVLNMDEKHVGILHM